MSLAVRIVLIALLAAVPIVLIQVVRELNLRDTRVADTLNTAYALARVTASRTDRFVEGARVLLVAASRVSAVRTLDGQQCSAELARIIAALPEFPAMAAFAPNGETPCLSDPTRPSVNIADRPYFQETLTKKAFVASDVVVGRQTGSGTIAFTYPALSDQGDVLAVMLMFINSAPLSELLNGPPIESGGFVALVDRSRVIAAHWPQPGMWTGRPTTDAGWLGVAFEGAQSTQTVSLNGGEEFALAVIPLVALDGYHLVYGLPLAPAFAESEQQFRRAIGSTLIVFVIAIALALVGARRWIARPVLELQEAADAMARGDLAARPATLSSIPEIRRVTEHVMRMAEALQTRMHQKEVLLKEVNHRVKNSLQLISSLYTLHRDKITDAEALRQFEEASAKVATVARVHQKLYTDERVDPVAFGTFLEEMCDELGAALNGAASSLQCNADECRLPTDQAIPLALIVNELVTNAYKYAYTKGHGDVRVRCKKIGNDVEITVEDDGVPLREDFTVQGHGGLGMRMISALLTQLRGTLEVVRRPSGKAFIVRAPI